MAYEVKVTLQRASGISEDAVVNTFHLASGPFDWADDVISPLFDFYEAIATAGLSNSIPRGNGHGHSVRIYDLDDPEPRVPVYVEGDFYLGGSAAAGTDLPAQLACVISWRQLVGSGVNPRRRYNRVFIGPLTSATSDGATEPRVSSDARTAFVDAAADLLESGGGKGSVFGIYSPSDDAFYIPDVAWVDDRFDTQRRRATDPTTRTTRVLT